MSQKAVSSFWALMRRSFLGVALLGLVACSFLSRVQCALAWSRPVSFEVLSDKLRAPILSPRLRLHYIASDQAPFSFSTRLFSSSTNAVPLAVSSSPTLQGSGRGIVFPDGRVLSFGFKPRPRISRVALQSTAVFLAIARRMLVPFKKWRWHITGLPYSHLTSPLISLAFVLLEAYVYLVPLRQLQLQLFYAPSLVPPEMLRFPTSQFRTLSAEDLPSSSPRLPSSPPPSSPILKLHALVHREGPGPGAPSSTSRSRSRGARYLVHCNHGFGANAFSFEPVLAPLARLLGRTHPALAVAHDAPGFGLTEVPKEGGRENGAGGGEGELFTFEHNARLGGRLMEELGREGERDGGKGMAEEADEGGERRVFLGHSMGALTSAYMAVRHVQQEGGGDGGREAESGVTAPVTLVMIAPAIMPMRQSPSRLPPAGRFFLGRLFPERVARYIFRKTGPALRASLLFLTASFLRALCYSDKFWMDGLSLAWGDGGPPPPSTVAHYRLPSLKAGWEGGLSRFVLAPLFAGRRRKEEPAVGEGRNGEKGDVLKALASGVKEGRLRVLLVHGERDRVVPLSNTRRLAAALRGQVGEGGGREGGVEVVELEGVGHVPHEEVPERFVQAVMDYLRKEEEEGQEGGEEDVNGRGKA